MGKVTSDIMIADLLTLGNQEEIASVLMGQGMHCLGCSIAKHETIEQAAAAHGIELEVLLNELNAVID